jgi:hypothetical protein
VCDPAFGLERCKSRQRFREGGFFYWCAAWLRGKGCVAEVAIWPAQAGWWRQQGWALNLPEEPIDFVGFSTILRSALQ